MSNQAPSPRLTFFDGYPTPTSVVQHETEEILLKHLPRPGLETEDSIPSESAATSKQSVPSQPANGPASKDDKSQLSPFFLNKPAHMQFLVRNLIQGFPGRYTSQDASQPWLMFWTLQSFSCLGVVLDPSNKQRVIDKVLTWQHPAGGFGGGPGQAAHLLTTYASVCALAIVGRPGPGGGWDDIDRKAVYDFFLSLKQKDGSFLVAHHAEVDVRGIYCLLVVATLLDILTPELVAGTPEFIASCQTYEGGFASASFPSYDPHNPAQLLKGAPRPPLGEAHGGYTFCALASWVLLQPYIALSTPDAGKRPQIDLKALTRWLVHMQGSQSELGGFRGRTNKLVDGCYSWWCGGSFSLLEALGVGGLENAKSVGDEVIEEEEEILKGVEGDDDWTDVDEGLFNSKALQEYILFAGQFPSGGLRDKPPKNADAYHTLYCLSGLSSAQHHFFSSKSKKATSLASWAETEKTQTKKNERTLDLGVREADRELDDALRREIFATILSWTEDPAMAASFSHIVGGKDNRLNATHPITNLTLTHTEGITKWAYGV